MLSFTSSISFHVTQVEPKGLTSSTIGAQIDAVFGNWGESIEHHPSEIVKRLLNHTTCILVIWNRIHEISTRSWEKLRLLPFHCHTTPRDLHLIMWGLQGDCKGNQQFGTSFTPLTMQYNATTQVMATGKGERLTELRHDNGVNGSSPHSAICECCNSVVAWILVDSCRMNLEMHGLVVLSSYNLLIANHILGIVLR